MIKVNAVKNYFNKFESATPRSLNKFLDLGKKAPSKDFVSQPQQQRPLHQAMNSIEQFKN